MAYRKRITKKKVEKRVTAGWGDMSKCGKNYDTWCLSNDPSGTTSSDNYTNPNNDDSESGR